MLVSTGPVPSPSRRWRYEPKLDGWRVLAFIDHGFLDVRTRSGRSIGDALPELVRLPAAVGDRAVLDAELVAGQGHPDDFYRLAPRLSATRPGAVRRWAARVPLTLAIFDILRLGDADVAGESYESRREILSTLHLSDASWCTVPTYDDGERLLASCERLGLEGVVAKRIDAPYRPGERSRSWVKIKTNSWLQDHGPRRHSAGPRGAPRVVSAM
jgi:bifunctional non-homologous end joining protein LigD